MEYHFFWGGPFSNWDDSPFRIDDTTYNCVEQYMMAMKAVTFNDVDSFAKIMMTHNPRKQKAIGRRVSGFDAGVWDALSFQLVFYGCLKKFQQNQEHRLALLDTDDKIIVEASPYDRIWGIGFDASVALNHIDRWGENRLGKVLMEVRKVI